MRTAAKFALPAVVAAGLIGLGGGTAFAGGHGHSHEDFTACVKDQTALGLIAVNLDVLTYCSVEIDD
ncbi:hypothetical protein [Nocardiopsis potens]|uniref:hypothetical protein n=1 Tax=Nocardiopsis potens TaxID=1246458 RepID=UPI000347F7A8|nr:hypothetical protein [Nocardiopsis potens]